MQKTILLSSLLLAFFVKLSAQLNPISNAPLSVQPMQPPCSTYNNLTLRSQSSDYGCRSVNTFYGAGGGGIDVYTLGDSTVTFDSSLANGAGAFSNLAFCENLNGGSPSPTFYSNGGYFTPTYLSDTGWVTCQQSYNDGC